MFWGHNLWENGWKLLNISHTIVAPEYLGAANISYTVMMHYGLRNSILLPTLTYGSQILDMEGHNNQESIWWKWVMWEGHDNMRTSAMKTWKKDVVLEFVQMEWSLSGGMDAKNYTELVRPHWDKWKVCEKCKIVREDCSKRGRPQGRVKNNEREDEWELLV